MKEQKAIKKMKEDKNESRWDKLFEYSTMGRDDTYADSVPLPYEPTPYLQRLRQMQDISVSGEYTA